MATKKKTKKKTAASATAAASNDVAIGRYVQAAGTIKAGLTKTIKHLKRERSSARIADRPWFTQAISQLRDEFAEVQEDLLAFLDEQLSIESPSSDDVKAIKKMAADLDKMIANAVAARTILNATTKLADSLQL